MDTGAAACGLWSAGSVVVAYRLRCSEAARGVPRSGIEPVSLAL